MWGEREGEWARERESEIRAREIVGQEREGESGDRVRRKREGERERVRAGPESERR